MFLYHGSNVEIKEINLSLSKPGKDFGRGFYLSDNFEQAYEMAKFKSAVFRGTPNVTKFEFDESLLTDGGLKVLSFSEYSREWADFVFKNRNQEDEKYFHDYDIVTGPIANDRVGVQIRRFVEGDIAFDTFLERLKYMNGVTFQYFFGTQKSIRTLQNKGLCYE